MRWLSQLLFSSFNSCDVAFILDTCCCSVVQTLCEPLDCSMPGLPVLHYLQEFAQTHVHWVSDATNHVILCCPLLLLLWVFPSIRVFPNKLTLRIRWWKNWRFRFSISPSNECSALISFKSDWFDILSVQGAFKSILQHHSLKASVLWRSAFFMVQLSHPYMTTGITIALTIWTIVGKVMSLLFNMLSRFVIAFLPRSKHLTFVPAVTVCSDFRAQAKKVCHC